MNRLRGHLTYANVISTICLFLVLGGGAAVAVTTGLPKNSVGSKQLKKGAVTPVKLNAASKKTLVGPQGPRGPEGLRGPIGPAGETGLPSTLPSGKTEKGSYGFASTRFEASNPVYSPGFQVSYPIPISFEPNTHVVKVGGPATPDCPGGVSDPTAAPGQLCLYAEREDVELTLENVPAEGKFGFLVFPEAEEGENYEVYGTWAVTAP